MKKNLLIVGAVASTMIGLPFYATAVGVDLSTRTVYDTPYYSRDYTPREDESETPDESDVPATETNTAETEVSDSKQEVADSKQEVEQANKSDDKSDPDSKTDSDTKVSNTSENTDELDDGEASEPKEEQISTVNTKSNESLDDETTDVEITDVETNNESDDLNNIQTTNAIDTKTDDAKANTSTTSKVKISIAKKNREPSSRILGLKPRGSYSTQVASTNPETSTTSNSVNNEGSSNPSQTTPESDSNLANTSGTETTQTNTQTSSNASTNSSPNGSGANAGNLFDELVQIKKAYEVASARLDEENKNRSARLNTLSVNAEEKQLEIARQENELSSLERRLNRSKQALIQSLERDNGDSSQLFGNVQTLQTQQDNIKSSISRTKQEEQDIRNAIESSFNELAAVNRKLDTLIFDTKKDIREVVEKRLNSPIDITTERAIYCSLDEPLKACMSKLSTKKEIIGPALYSKLASEGAEVNDEFLNNIDYDFIEFKYLNAYQRLDGQTYFNAQAKVSINANLKLFSSLYRLAGLPETGVNKLFLTSNKDATFYVDGKRIGKGQRVVVDIERGSYNIKATYQDKAQSTRERIADSTSLYYGFD